eukprot:GHVS01002842.1.p2 GENE.GHVS01002842.1~~GHVS01002842.1.p2  ORF type:complete len:101 (-),score=7.02 GHVS01002842.1:36-338(-)
MARKVASLVESSDIITMIKVNGKSEFDIVYKPTGDADNRVIGRVEDNDGIRFVLAHCDTTKCDVVSVARNVFYNCIEYQSGDYAKEISAKALQGWLTSGD